MPGLRASSFVRSALTLFKLPGAVLSPCSLHPERQKVYHRASQLSAGLDTSGRRVTRSPGDPPDCRFEAPSQILFARERGPPPQEFYEAGPDKSRRNLYKSSAVPQMAATSSDATASTSDQDGEEIYFGPYKIRSSEVFFESELSRALVNLKPIVPGEENRRT
jgi:hypothetical protein